MKIGPRVILYRSLGALLLLTSAAFADAQSDPSSYGSVRKMRAELFVLAGRQPLEQMAGNVFEFAVESERCRIAYGSKTCGLPPEALKSGELESVFDYYVRQPMNSAVDRQVPSAHKEDWNWGANASQSAKSGESQR